MTLDGKVVAVTGAFGALGAAVARHAAGQNACVALIDRAASPVGTPLPGALVLGGVDLADTGAAAGALDRVAAHFGGLDALVNVAGGFRWETVEGGSVETWDFLYRLNLRTALCASHGALPHLLARGGGRIVCVGAASAARAGLGMGAYAASKAGVARLVEALAEEFKDRGITVNAVLPGIIDTPQNRAEMPNADVSRWVSPDALAGIIGFLLSDAAIAVTGALLPVTGRL